MGMRTEAEMMELILAFARRDERIRVVGMEGSRTNPKVPKDQFQDYDVSYLVTDMESFKKDDAWLDYFGKRIIMQKPEAMSLFPPELGNWFSYLMLFTDGNRIDLKLVPLDELDRYLSSDKLLAVLLDKDGRVPDLRFRPIGITTSKSRRLSSLMTVVMSFGVSQLMWLKAYVVKKYCMPPSILTFTSGLVFCGC